MADLKSPQPVVKNEGAEVRIALALTMIWLLICALYVLGVPNALEASTRSLLALLLTFSIMFFPLTIIWTVAYVAGNVRRVRAESEGLRRTLDEIRVSMAAQPKSQDKTKELQRQLDEIATMTLQTDVRVTELSNHTFKAQGDNPPPRTNAAALGETVEPEPDLSQSKLPLATPDGPERMPITIVEFIKALNFPDNAEDKEGFRVLRRAFEERDLGRLLQASQDILTLLSQDGIYMDDLRPDQPRPAVWRKFAAGKRGTDVSALGGIRDRSALTLAKTRMKNDPVFRDAAHHFLRRFDQVLVAFEEQAEDNELLEMAQTRSARAFMLLGKAAGSFD
ncbi:MAG: hypothetical protein AAF393_10295 [Pseudomonadota bacterium]